MQFIKLINVKMPTIVGILTFISLINTSEFLKQEQILICQHFSIKNEILCTVQLSMKKVLYVRWQTAWLHRLVELLTVCMVQVHV